MFGLLVDKDWYKERWETEPRRRKRGLLPGYSGRLLVCVLLVVGGLVLARNVGDRPDAAPVPKAEMRLM
jgi:hypothetical protein